MPFQVVTKRSRGNESKARGEGVAKIGSFQKKKQVRDVYEKMYAVKIYSIVKQYQEQQATLKYIIREMVQ